MRSRLQPLLLPLVVAALALAAYNLRVKDEMADFDVYRRAAVRALHAEPLYQPADGHYQFKYLPVFALGMTPFALVDIETAKAGWFAVSFGLLVAFVRWSVRGLPERRWPETTLIWVTLVLMAKFYAHELVLGQTNLLLGAMLVAALLTIQIDQPRAAAVLIALSSFVKPYALLLLPWLAVTQGLTPALVAAGVFGAGLLLPAAVYGWSGNLQLLADWWHTVAGTTGANLLGADNISLAAMWAKWIGPGRTAAVLTLVSGAALLTVAALIVRRRRGIDTPDYLEFAFLLLAIPLISPQGWDYVLLLATPAVICLLDRWQETTPPWRWTVALALATMGLTMFDVMGRASYGRFMALSIISVAALVTAAGLAHLRVRRLA